MAGCYIILNFPLEHNRTRCTFLSGKERTGRFGTIAGDVELATRSLTETVCKRTLRPLTIRGEVIGGEEWSPGLLEGHKSQRFSQKPSKAHPG
jgi:hypothetical protein